MSIDAARTTTANAVSITITRIGMMSRRPIDSRGELADAVQVEDRLGQDRAAADHLGHVQAPQRDDRDQAVAQDVAEQHLALGQPLGVGGADVVLVDRVEDRRAQDARVEADEQHREREPGQDQVHEPLHRALW